MRKWIRELQRMARLSSSRGIVQRVDPSAGRQTVQVEGLAGELIDGAEHWQPYGMTAHPPAGSEAVMLALGGARSHAVAIAVENRAHRPRDLEAGEVALYDDQTQEIRLARDGIEVFSADQVTIQVGNNVEITVSSAGVTIKAGPSGLLRLEGLAIELAATERIKLDVGGRGYTYYADRQVNWTQGTSSSTVPPAPPEHAP